MTDPAAPDDAAAPPLTEEALSAFGVIADWCETQRGEAETTAQRQFRMVWWLLGAGLVLLLTLPRIVAFIDYLGREESLPPLVVQEAAEAKALLDANKSEMQTEVVDARAELSRLKAEIAGHEAKLEASEADLRAAIMAPPAVWIRPEIVGLEGSAAVETLLRAPDGTLIAAGSESDRGPSITLLLRSPDGVDWTPVRPEAAGERLAGRIRALIAAPDGTLVAAGWEAESDELKVLLLRSTDGIDWTPVRPEAAGERLEGGISALVVAPDGTLIAAGWEGDYVLLLRSADGVDWRPVRPQAVGARLEGRMSALVVAPGGALIAAGWEDDTGDDRVLLLRSTDGVDWTPVRPEAAGARLTGWIDALIATPDGTLIAAGAEGDVFESRILLLRSADGLDWTPVRPEAAGARLEGQIDALIAAPDGTLIAAGWENDKILLLRSTDGLDWTPVRPEAAGARLEGQIDALIAAPDGTLIAAGTGVGILKSVGAAEIPGIAKTLLEDGVLPPGLIVPEGTGQRLRGIAERRAAIAVLQTQEAQQQAFLKTAEDSLNRQKTAVETLETVAANLEAAVRTAEPVRQASRIGTRLAVVALLIFLVQIVVNKYRYLQRLAGFYQARAQAFRMLAAADTGLDAHLLRGVTVTELIASLSPDAIRFDKTATPPTDNLAKFLQSGLRRN